MRTSVRFGGSYTYNPHAGTKKIKGSTGFELLCPIVSYRIMFSMPPVVIGYKPRQLWLIMCEQLAKSMKSKWLCAFA